MFDNKTKSINNLSLTVSQCVGNTESGPKYEFKKAEFIRNQDLVLRLVKEYFSTEWSVNNTKCLAKFYFSKCELYIFNDLVFVSNKVYTLNSIKPPIY